MPSEYVLSRYFNPLPPRGGRQYLANGIVYRSSISTHSLLAEGDTNMISTTSKQQYFNPLPPRGGRQVPLTSLRLYNNFNPLPPRGGRPVMPSEYVLSRNFNPLPPRGGRPAPVAGHSAVMQFQPTPSSRRETMLADEVTINAVISTHSLLAEGDKGFRAIQRHLPISTHSLLAEGDRLVTRQAPKPSNFNPLPPRGGRLPATESLTEQDISTHSLLAEGDAGQVDNYCSIDDFNPLPPRGGRPHDTRLTQRPIKNFNPLPPRGGRLVDCEPSIQASTFQPTPSSRRET